MDDYERSLAEVVDALKNADWGKHRAQLEWRLNAHRCRDAKMPTCLYAEAELCPDFEKWKAGGRELYDDSLQAYQEKIAREIALRERIRQLPPVERFADKIFLY